MIKTISNITNISFIEHHGSDGSLLPLNSLSFSDNIIGSGGFGNVFKIESVNGIQTQKYLLKIIENADNQEHAYKTISILHNKLKRSIHNTSNLVSHIYPELLGIPIIAFNGYNEIDNHQIMGLIMHDLSNNEYEDFGSDTFDKSKYFEIDISDKLYLAYQLSKSVNYLHDINFIHSDLSENAIWINFKTSKLTLIDFDSGFHHDIQKKPTTIGKIGQWIGSRYRKILSNEGNKDNLTLQDRIQEENWVLASSIFELIFGISPFFFLKDALDETKTKYLKENTWPYISANSHYLNKNNSETHIEIIKRIQYLEQNGLQNLIKAFEKVFNKGYKNEKQRLRSSDWKNILYEICVLTDSVPIIESFKSDKESVKSSQQNVKFDWKVKKGNLVYIDDHLIDSDFHSKTFQESSTVTIKIVNDFGESTKSINIEAVKINPVIKSFTSNTYKKTDLTPVTLSWEAENSKFVILENLNSQFQSIDSIEVNPKEKTTYRLKAIGNFDQEIIETIIIDVTLATITFFKYEINIENGIDNIELFWETNDTIEVSIIPRIGIVSLSGSTVIGIGEKTEFTLVAKGHFNEVSKTIETKPFPIPIIKGIFVPTPTINIDFVVPENNLKIPDILNTNLEIKFNNSISFTNMLPNFTELEIKINQIEKSKTVRNNPTKLFENLFKTLRKNKL
jgi:serine/threonine protein kinase